MHAGLSGEKNGKSLRSSLLARLAFPDEPLAALACHNASILCCPDPVTRQPYNHDLRLDRALEYLQSLEVEVQRWLGTKPYGFVQEFHAQRGEHTIRVVPREPPSAKLNLILSDCLHELRSALDNLVYDLAVAHNGGNPLPTDVEERVMFPICEDEGKCPMWRIRDIAPSAQAIIKDLQPYHRGNDYRFDPLWQLNELSRIDKHRLLHVTLIGQQGSGFETRSNVAVHDYPSFRLGAIEHTGRHAEDGAEIISYGATPIDPSDKMSVYFDFALGIAFGGGSPANAQPVLEVLSGLRSYILNRVRPLLAPYLTYIPILQVSHTYCLLPSRG